MVVSASTTVITYYLLNQMTAHVELLYRHDTTFCATASDTNHTETPSEPLPPFHIALYDSEGLVVLDGPYEGKLGEFVRAGDGSVAWLRFGLRAIPRCGNSPRTSMRSW